MCLSASYEVTIKIDIWFKQAQTTLLLLMYTGQNMYRWSLRDWLMFGPRSNEVELLAETCRGCPP